jgi:hypothetical protein
MHEVRRAGDRGGRKRKRLEQARVRARRRRHRRARRCVVEVVRETDRDAACSGLRECVADDLRERVGQPDVVDRDLERVLRLRDPVREQVRDLVRRLAAVGQRRELYRAAFARSSALCARFAAW